MQASLIALLSAVAAATAFTIPKDLGDGVFVVPKGSEEAVLLTSIDKRASIDIPKRQLPVSDQKCYDGEDMLDGVNYEQAKANLGAMCDEGTALPGGSSLVARIGSAAVYGCSWGGQNPCSSDEVNGAMDIIDGNCGNLHPGDIWLQDWAKIWGRGKGWEKFCENA